MAAFDAVDARLQQKSLTGHVQDIKIRFVAAGPSSCHCILGDMEGQLYTWGRNEVRCHLCCLLSCSRTHMSIVHLARS